MRLGKSEIKFFLVIAIMISALIGAAISNDLRTAYEKLEPVSSAIGNSRGLIAADDATTIPVITTMDELVEAKGDKVVLEVDADKIEASGVVIEGNNTYAVFPANTNLIRKFMFIYTNKVTAQNYVVTLDDGEKVVVALCDLAYDVPSKGRVKLPIGELKKFTSVSNDDKYQKLGVSKENTVYRMDCYSDLGILDEIHKANTVATTRAVIIMMAVFIASSVILIVTSFRQRRQG